MGASSVLWLERQGKQMSPFGARVADLVGDLFSGIYHISGPAMKADWSQTKNIELTVHDAGFSTFDSDLLTRLVLLAHDRNIRASIQASTHGYFKLTFVAVDRTGFFADRHPTLEEAIARYK